MEREGWIHREKEREGDRHEWTYFGGGDVFSHEVVLRGAGLGEGEGGVGGGLGQSGGPQEPDSLGEHSDLARPTGGLGRGGRGGRLIGGRQY